MKHAMPKIAALSLTLCGLPLAACAAAENTPSAPPAMHSSNDLQQFPTNTHAQTFDYEYTLKPVTVDGYTIIAKHLANGSRWALLDGSWYDIDFSPHVVSKIATQALTRPDNSHLIGKEAGSKAHRQYEIDLDYFNASVDLRSL